MRVPVVQGVIDRRILVNYRVKPEAIAAVLPAPFRPKLVRGHAIGGVCLIRLKHIRPLCVPLPVGIQSENAAHRIAVEWDRDGRTVEGVFIPRRDTDSRLSTLVGGRLFPGRHHHAAFTMDERDDRLAIALTSDDGRVSVSLAARPADDLPLGSIFGSLAEASCFFENGSLGYSATDDPDRFDGLELRCRNWSLTPLVVDHVRSSFFDNPTAFPPGSVAFDCALLMRGIAHEWHSQEDLCCPAAV